MQFIPELEKHVINLFAEDEIVMLEGYKWLEKYQKDVFLALGDNFSYLPYVDRRIKKIPILAQVGVVPPKARVVIAVLSFFEYMGLEKAFNNQDEIKEIIGMIEDYTPFERVEDFIFFIQGLDRAVQAVVIQAVHETNLILVGQLNQLARETAPDTKPSLWRRLWLRLKKKQ